MKTLDVTEIVQSIVDRPGWERGEISPPLTVPQDTVITACFVEVYDSSPGEAVLEIDYQQPNLN